MSTDDSIGADEPTADDWKRLAEAVRGRRTKLGLSQDALRGRGGPSASAVQSIEQQKRTNFSGRTLGQIEIALQWPSGICRQILAGTATDADLNRRVARKENYAQVGGSSITGAQLDESRRGANTFDGWAENLAGIAGISPEAARQEIDAWLQHNLEGAASLRESAQASAQASFQAAAGTMSHSARPPVPTQAPAAVWRLPPAEADVYQRAFELLRDLKALPDTPARATTRAAISELIVEWTALGSSED